MADDVQPAFTLASTLDSVTVHASGALCRRTARLELPRGSGPDGAPAPVRVILTGLPLTLDEQSLRATVLSGPPGLRVLDVRRAVEAALRSEQDLSPLRHDADQAQAELDTAQGALAALAQQIEHIAALRAVPAPVRRGDPPRRAPVDALLALADFVADRLAELDQRLSAAQDQVREAEQRAQAARRRLAEASAALPTERVRSTTGVVLALRSDGAERPPTTVSSDDSRPDQPQLVELELEYAVPGAAWAPGYQLRLTGIDGDQPGGVLAMRARVAQRTGEDWTGVRIVLSTADLRRHSELLPLASLRLGRRQTAQPPSPWREPPTGLGSLFADYDAFVGSAPTPVAGPVGASALAAGPPPVFGGAPLPSVPPPAPLRRHTALIAPSAAKAAPASAQSPDADQQAEPRRVRHAGAIRGLTPVGPGAGLDGPPGPGVPDPALRDLGRLVLAGADEPASERGQLRVAEEQLSRHQATAVLGLPPGCLPVRESAGSFDYRYDTAAPVDVPADGGWHSVPVREFPVELAVEHLCTAFAATTGAQSQESVHAALLLRNSSGNALLAGSAEVTVDGAYLRSVELPTLAPGQQRRVGLGVVEGIRMARRVHMRESTAGLRGGTTVLEHAVEIELANRLGHPVSVEVRERVPVSDDKDVRIEDRPATPPWTAVPPEQDEHHQRGLRVWRVTLAPHTTTVLTGGFEIRIPVARAIADGNRRF